MENSYKQVRRILKKYSDKVIESKSTNTTYYHLINTDKQIRLSDHIGKNPYNYYADIVYLKISNTYVITLNGIFINSYPTTVIKYIESLLLLFEFLTEMQNKIVNLQSETDKLKRKISILPNINKDQYAKLMLKKEEEFQALKELSCIYYGKLCSIRNLVKKIK